MIKKPKAVVIGGGLAGLSAAIRLQTLGYDTTVLEKNSHLGGKLHQVKLGTHSFDFGPNTITMPHVFQYVLRRAGENPDDYFQFNLLQRHTKNVFPDGSSFDFTSDAEEMMGELAKIDGESARRYPAYLREVARLYEFADRNFLHRTFSSWRDFISIPLAMGMLRVRPLENLDHFHRRYFKDERIVRAFNRYATYIGSSPFSAPATFGLIGHLEMSNGVYYTRGGNYRIAQGFVSAAKKLGVAFRTETEVVRASIKNGRIHEVITGKDEVFGGDVFILNGDLLTQVPRLIESSARPRSPDSQFAAYEPSVSAFVVLAALNRRLPLHHHQVFFSDNARGEFEDIFTRSRYGSDPTIYLCTSSKSDESISPEGDNVFILVNAPPLTAEGELALDSGTVKENIGKSLKTRGIDVDTGVVACEVIDPKDIAERFRAYRGALYGVASNRRKDAFLRPYNRSRDIENLFFVGGSTHPGGGSPMVVLSGQNVADVIGAASP